MLLRTPADEGYGLAFYPTRTSPSFASKDCSRYVMKERNPVAKTQAQIEKKKRETEKRKKTEKAILKLAAELPDEDPKQGQTVPVIPSKATKGKA